MSIRVDEIHPQDYDAVIKLNSAVLPGFPLSRASLAEFLAHAGVHAAAWIDEQLVGFMYALRPGMAYGCPNYHWFSERYQDFLYVDRMMVLPNYRRRGAGRAMYDAAEAALRGKGLKLALEVARKPLDEDLMGFHRAVGFEEVGTRTIGSSHEIAMMAKRLS